MWCSSYQLFSPVQSCAASLATSELPAHKCCSAGSSYLPGVPAAELLKEALKCQWLSGGFQIAKLRGAGAPGLVCLSVLYQVAWALIETSHRSCRTGSFSLWMTYSLLQPCCETEASLSRSCWWNGEGCKNQQEVGGPGAATGCEGAGGEL